MFRNMNVFPILNSFTENESDKSIFAIFTQNVKFGFNDTLFWHILGLEHTFDLKSLANSYSYSCKLTLT